MSLPPASADGFKRAEEIADEFSTDLLEEAGRIARRREAEQASRAHVEDAASHLYSSRRNRQQQYLASFGALIAGIGGSATVNFLQADSPNGVYSGISSGVMVLGAILAVSGLRGRSCMFASPVSATLIE